jgi:hypothetical protein
MISVCSGVGGVGQLGVLFKNNTAGQISILLTSLRPREFFHGHAEPFMSASLC